MEDKFKQFCEDKTLSCLNNVEDCDKCEIKWLKTELSRLQQQNKELIEALKPFKNVIDFVQYAGKDLKIQIHFSKDVEYKNCDVTEHFIKASQKIKEVCGEESNEVPK